MLVIVVWVFMCCCVEVLCMFLFFFFKQKTAYEMRISDWSSDVCSSDLTEKTPIRCYIWFKINEWARPGICNHCKSLFRTGSSVLCWRVGLNYSLHPWLFASLTASLSCAEFRPE